MDESKADANIKKQIGKKDAKGLQIINIPKKLNEITEKLRKQTKYLSKK